MGGKRRKKGKKERKRETGRTFNVKLPQTTLTLLIAIAPAAIIG